MQTPGLITSADNANKINTPQANSIMWYNTSNGNYYRRDSNGTDTIITSGLYGVGTVNNVAVFDTTASLAGPIPDNVAGIGRRIALVAPAGSTDGGALVQSAGEGLGGDGGDANLTAGDGSVNGGNLVVQSGTGNGGLGGSANLIAAPGSTGGGAALVQAGSAVSGNAGDATILGGSSTGGNGNGGGVVISPGTKNGSGHDGRVTILLLPSFADDAAAGVGGLTAGQIYRTSGAGAAPLDAAGILMIKL